MKRWTIAFKSPFDYIDTVTVEAESIVEAATKGKIVVEYTKGSEHEVIKVEQEKFSV